METIKRCLCWCPQRIPLPLILPKELTTRDEMTDEEFSAMLQKGMDDVQAGRTSPAKEVFADLRRGLS